jgi:very-long-chain enoyl-CoA reductase
MPLTVANISSATDIALKNLGPQISWSMVFYIEYAGPLLIFPMLFLLGDRNDYELIHYLALLIAVVHYAKRLLETAFVHVFSRNSMPFKRVFVNSFHYWVLFAAFNGVELFFFPIRH